MIWVLLVFLFLPIDAWGASETLYVRPTAACANNGDGTAYGCAASGGAPGAWRGFASLLFSGTDETAGRIDPGDYVYVCGTFLAADVQQAGTMLNVAAMGVNTIRITYDGNCTSSGGLSVATLDGENVTTNGLYTAQRTLFTFQNMVVQNYTSKGAFLYTNSVSDVPLDKQIILSNITISSIRGAAAICLDARGKNITLTGLVISTCGSDGIWQNGTGFTVRNSQVSGISIDAGNAGDGLQMSGEVDGALIEDNTIDMTQVDSKYCGLVQGTTDNGSIIVQRNTCLRLQTQTVGSGWRFDELTNLTFRANKTIGGQYNVQANLLAVGNYQIYGNTTQTPSERCINIGGVGAGIAAVYNNTCVGAVTWGIMVDNTGGATVTLRNNIVSGGGALCINKRAANTETHNVLYNCTNAVGNSDVPGTADGTDILSNPLLISSTDLRTAATSPARQAGAWWGNSCTDVRGRPCFPGQIDIGAYQASSGDQATTRSAASVRSAASTRNAASARTAR